MRLAPSSLRGRLLLGLGLGLSVLWLGLARMPSWEKEVWDDALVAWMDELCEEGKGASEGSRAMAAIL